MITRKDIAAHLERNVRTGFVLGRQEYRPLRSAFTAEKPSTGGFEDYADMGAPPWPVKLAGTTGPGGRHSETDAEKVNAPDAGGVIEVIGGIEKAIRVYNVDWHIAIGIEHNAIDDDQAGDLESWARAAGSQFEKHKDFVCFDALNKGEGTTYGQGSDHLSFFNDSHIDPGAQYQTAQDNKYALALSLDNFETVKVASAKFLDDRGQPVGLDHRVLIVPPDLEYLAFQIAQNPQAYDTANREANAYAGRVTPLVAPGGWLDTTAWFLVDGSLPVKPINLQVRKNAELVMWDDEKTGSGVRYFKFHARYSAFYGDWRTCVEGNT